MTTSSPRLVRILPVVLSTVLCASAYAMEGHVTTRNGSTRFDETSVVGPNINLTRDSTGEWRGMLGRLVISATETPNRISGANISIGISHQNGMMILDGYVGRRRFRYVIPESGTSRIEYGPKQAARFINFSGAAAAPNPPAAQMAFSLVAAN